jgi:hypothetical protein
MLNSSDHGTPSHRLEPALLIWGKCASRRFYIISLKRQEPTRRYQSQLPSPLSANINSNGDDGLLKRKRRRGSCGVVNVLLRLS